MNINFFRNKMRFLYILGMLVATIFTVTFLIYNVEKNNLEQEAIIRAEKDIELLSKSFEERISFINIDIIILKEFVSLHEALSIVDGDTVFNSAEDREILEKEFLVWLDTKNIYDQARIIDNNGQEILRVNYNQGDPEIVPIEDLQNKAGRYYFTDSIILDNNQMYISQLDLNMENGAIEIIDGETKPMIRFATPVFDSEGNKLGIIILNYLAQDVLELFTQVSDADIGTIELINEAGYFLYSPEAAREWGFMYDDKLDEIYSKYYIYNALTDATTIVGVDEVDNIHYISVTVTDETLSDKTSLSVDSEIDVILGVGDFIIVSSIDMSKLDTLSTLKTTYTIIVLLLFVTSLGITRLIDELIYSREERYKAVKFASTHDTLTKIPNRNYIVELIGNKITDKEKLSILFIDFDGFKTINDEYGHSVGDLALIAGVKRINTYIRQSDIIGRIGGDEFIVVLSNTVDKIPITRICNSIIKSFQEDFVLDNNIVNMGVSIGISRYPDEGNTTDEITDNADKAMYHVKNNEKNNFAFFDEIEKK